MSYPKERIMLLQVAISCQIKSPVPGEVYVYSAGWLEVERKPQDPAVTLGCPPAVHGKTLLQKIPPIWSSGLKKSSFD